MNKWMLICALILTSSCAKQNVICEQTGGKWGSVKSECIRPSCAKNKTCGQWANPANWCNKIRIGEHKDNVRFWLGEPDNETHQSMTWNAFKAESQKITAEFRQS